MKHIKHAQSVIQHQAQALQTLSSSLDSLFCDAVELILNCRGKVVVTGVGKSGAIGRKVAATLCSTGTRSCWIHSTELAHGDLGQIEPIDIVIAISNSGETREVNELLFPNPIIAVTSNVCSTLAERASVVLNTHVTAESCPLNKAPTTSTTTALVLLDALAICLMIARGFTVDDFLRFHPGGDLGKAL